MNDLTEAQIRQIDEIVEPRSLGELDAVFGRSSKTRSGVKIDEQTALSFSAVWRALVLVGQLVGRMPLHVYRRAGDSREQVRNHPAEYLLNDEANEDVDAATLRETATMLAMAWGRCELEIERRGDGLPVALHLLPPWDTKPDRTRSGQLVYRVRRDDQREDVVPAWNVLAIVGPSPDGIVGYRTVQVARESIALGVAMQMFGASFFGNGVRPSGVLMTDKTLSDEAYARMRRSFREQYASTANTGETLLLEDGTKFEPFGIANDEAQFLEGRNFQVGEVARWFGIPPHLLYDLSRATFSNIEEQGADFLTFGLSPWYDRWERAGKRRLLLPSERPDHYLETNTDKITRADLVKRYNAYQIGRNGGWLSVNEIRRAENKPSIGPAGDVYLQPLNMAPAGSPAADPSKPSPDPAKPATPTRSNPRAFATAARSALVEAIERALRLQANAATRAAKRPDAWPTWLDGFAGEHRRLTAEVLAPIVRMAVVGLELVALPGVMAEDLADAIVAESRARLAAIAETRSTEQSLAAAVEAEVSDWPRRAVAAAESVVTLVNAETSETRSDP